MTSLNATPREESRCREECSGANGIRGGFAPVNWERPLQRKTSVLGRIDQRLDVQGERKVVFAWRCETVDNCLLSMHEWGLKSVTGRHFGQF